VEEYIIEKNDEGFFVKDSSEKYTIRLDQRIFNFVIRIVKYLKSIQKSVLNNVIINQLAKSVTSIGANYEEAQGASSKKDFIAKVAISHREAKETNYWLRIIKESDLNKSSELDYLLQESLEIRNILGSIVGKARNNLGK